MLGARDLAKGEAAAREAGAVACRLDVADDASVLAAARWIEEAFGRCDVMLLPASPTLPFALGEKTADPLAMYLSDIFTIGANLAGIPGLTVPVGLTKGALPKAVQLLGPEDAEPTLLRAARAIEVRGETKHLPASYETEFAWPTKP